MAMDKNEAIKREFYFGNLDKAIEVLKEAQGKGENIYINFNNHKLYSADITTDSAYLEVTGKTKEGFEKDRAEFMKKWDEKEAAEKAEAKQKVPQWVERGKEFIYPEKIADWEKCVTARAGDLYHGAELDSALEVMKAIHNGASLDEAKEILDSHDHSGASYGMTRSIICHFSEKGPEFWEHTAYEPIKEEDKKVLEELKEQNARLKEEHETVRNDFLVDGKEKSLTNDELAAAVLAGCEVQPLQGGEPGGNAPVLNHDDIEK